MLVQFRIGDSGCRATRDYKEQDQKHLCDWGEAVTTQVLMMGKKKKKVSYISPKAWLVLSDWTAAAELQ